jgi:Fe-S oxidoreductase/nitrate reductase gamma subunit
VDSKPLVLAALMLLAFAFAGYRFFLRLRPMFGAPGIDRLDHVGERLWGLVPNVLLHHRLLNIRYSGILHAMIFSSFIVLFTAIIQAFGSGLFPGFSLAPVGGNSVIALLQDVFAVIILIGVGMAFYNRFVIKPARFKGSNNKDATIILLLVIGVVASMLLEFSFHIAAGGDPSAPWRPLSSTIARLLEAVGFEGERASQAAHVFYWIHVCVILGFLTYIPGSKHLHMFAAIPNIFLRNIGPKGQSRTPDPKATAIGLSDVLRLDWKGMLDLYSCTECGRCQAACPAYAAGLPLSPKILIMNMRDALIEETVAPAAKPPAEPAAGSNLEALVGSVISEQTLWACTTCRACMEVCPLHIEHVPKIVDMRRHMVEAGHVTPGIQDAMASLQQYGNSFKKPPRMRAKWTSGLDFKIKDARKEEVDILWFVGDFASYDPRVQRITQTVARLLKKAGVDFGILYDAEQNSGNDVRRVGDEGLFQTLSEHNIEALASCRFKRIMTTDPHSLNALRQEYPAQGAKYEVVHYTQLLLELLQQGKLEAAANARTTGVVTYHDPCYLGRYNNGFEPPRQIFAALGYRLHEMGRCRENSFCCGAGGGRIWQDDTGIKERPSENRIREALALGDATIFAVACPKDLVMYTAAVQSLAVEDKIQVKDIAELFA